jgi:hypothetical protein
MRMHRINSLRNSDNLAELPPVRVLALSITLVLAVIIDLDRPLSGFIRASQQPMIDLLHRQ